MGSALGAKVEVSVNVAVITKGKTRAKGRGQGQGTRTCMPDGMCRAVADMAVATIFITVGKCRSTNKLQI